jgi:hypothetical protein
MAQRDTTDRAETVKVVVRCRPFSTAESTAALRSVVQVDNEARQVVVTDLRSATSDKIFTFDAVFGVATTQQEVRRMNIGAADGRFLVQDLTPFAHAGVRWGGQEHRGERLAGLQRHGVCVRADRSREDTHHGGQPRWS